MSKVIKVYVVGHSTGYASWINNYQIVKGISEADVVLFTGGEDVNPKLYNEKIGRYTHFNITRDSNEILKMKEAVELNKPVFGICRGAQLMCVLAGGKLVQHMQHPSHHNLIFYDNTEVMTNSLHHQLQYPYDIPNEDYKILAYANGLSNTYLDGNNNNISMKYVKGREVEPEFVYYKKLKGLGIQGHPEMMGKNTRLVKLCNMYLNHLIEGTIDIVLQNLIPLDRLMSDDFKFTDEELERHNGYLNNKLDNGEKEQQTKEKATEDTYADVK